MLRNLFQRFSTDNRSDAEQDQQPLVLYARLSHQSANEPSAGRTTARSLPNKRNLPDLKPNSSHRARLFSMRLEHIQFAVHIAASVYPNWVSLRQATWPAHRPISWRQFRAPRRALRVLKQYRRAIRFAASVPGMMPRDAMLLISIHRRSTHGLSLESAAQLHRDLVRFSQSSQGQIQLRGRRVPSIRRLKQWINECKESSVQSPLHARAA